MRNIFIAGGSRGLGYSMVEGLARHGDKIYIVSRTPPPVEGLVNINVEWIPADLSQPTGLNDVFEKLEGQPLDVLIYNAGTWEQNGFEDVPGEEIMSIINVNLTSAILLSQKLIPSLRLGNLKKIILVGSTCGLENEGSDSVVYNATKFALRGVAHSLREYLRKDQIAVTCLNPGSIASDVSFSEGDDTAMMKYSGSKIPAGDIISILNMVIECSPATCIKEINVPALMDTDV